LFPIIVRKADLVLVQHQGQEATLRNKGIASEIFNNLLDHNRMPDKSSSDKTDFSYVGALDRRKGLIDFYHLASRNRDLTFKVIGAPRDRTGYYYFKKLKKLQNVKLYGKLGHYETMHEILNSKGLVSTSPMEGFPNVFIEAWNYGLPVFSLKFDPGDVILRENLGVITNGNLKQLASALASFETNEEFSSRVKQYVTKHHLINELKTKEVTSLFERIFKSTKGNKSKPRFLSFFAILLFFQKVILHKMLVYENFAC
jgi:glycosyltransferase involved in cell wall biosynthesis